MRRLAVILILSVLCVSCAKENAEKPSDKTTATLETKEADSMTLATVNGVPISSEDLKDEFNALNAQAQKMFMTNEGLKSLLDEVVKKEVLYQEASKRPYASDKEFQELVDQYKKNLMVGFLLREEVEKKADVSDSEVRRYYDENRKDFVLEASGDSDAQVLEFDDVSHLIKRHLAEKKQDEVFSKYIETVKKSYNVNINEDAFAKAFGNAVAPTPGIEVTEPQK